MPALIGLPARDVVELGRGSDSVAFSVGGEWVFRFPLAPDAQNTLRRELALLPQLAPVLPLAIPAVEHVGRDGDRLLFAGYRLLPGEPLRAPDDDALAALAAFLQALHAFPVDVAKRAGVRHELMKGGYHPGQRELLERVAHLLEPGAVERHEAAFAAYERDFPAVEPRLLHSDLKPAHVLYDAAAGRIGGVLDWGDVALGDPDFDLAVIAIFFGQEVQRRLLAHLPDRDPEVIAAKTRFFTDLRELQDLAYDIELGERPPPGSTSPDS